MSNIDKDTQTGDKKDQPIDAITIIVNGRPKPVTQKELSFEEIVQLAFPGSVPNDTTVYTITYKRGHGHKPEGTLVAGEVVKVKEGMIFNVTATDKS